MRAHRRQRRLRRLRSFVLGGIAALLFVLIGLFVLGRQGMQTPSRASGESEVPLRSDTITYEARGFNHLVSVGDRPLFRIRAERSTSASSREPRLEDVELTWFRPDGEPYSISSLRGSFNLATREARLEGEVTLRGPDALRLRTDQLQLSPRARWVSSNGPVQLGWGDQYHGRAGNLRAELNENLFQLEKGVVVAGRNQAGRPVALRSRRVNFDRDRHLLIARGNARVRFGEDLMSARELAMRLDEQNRDPESLTAEGEVSGSLKSSARPAATEDLSTAHFSGERLTAEFSPEHGGIRRLELRSSSQVGPVIITTRDQEGSTRRLRSRVVVAHLGEDGLEQIQTPEATTLTSTRAGASETPDRTIQSGPVRAAFSQGELARVDFSGPVEISSERGRGRGSTAHFDAVADEFQLSGSPALAETEQGTLWAPELVWNLAGESLRGLGGVRAQMQGGNGPQLPAAQESEEDEPIQIEAQEAEWRQGERRYRFQGDVRAWQGASFLLADEVSGSVRPDTLVAKGQVSTRWLQPAEPEEAPSASPGGEDAEIATREPLEMRGTQLAVDRAAEIIEVAGPATIRQGQRNIECQEIAGTLDAEGRVQTLDCSGRVRIVDPASGRHVTGTVAHYDAESGLIHVTGEPVTLHSRDGSRISGSRLLYDLADGSAEVLGRGSDAMAEGAAVAADTLMDPGAAGRTDPERTDREVAEPGQDEGEVDPSPESEDDGVQAPQDSPS